MLFVLPFPLSYYLRVHTSFSSQQLNKVSKAAKAIGSRSASEFHGTRGKLNLDIPGPRQPLWPLHHTDFPRSATPQAFENASSPSLEYLHSYVS